MIAIPDLSFGAMENWGLVTYRLDTMLYDPVVSATNNKERIAGIVSHELAHQVSLSKMFYLLLCFVITETFTTTYSCHYRNIYYNKPLAKIPFVSNYHIFEFSNYMNYIFLFFLYMEI